MLRSTDSQPADYDLRVRGEADRRGFSLADHHVVLGDHAAGIGSLAQEQIPHAIPIVDLIDARLRLRDPAKVLFPQEPTRCTLWAEQRLSTHPGNRFDGFGFWADQATTGVPSPATRCITLLDMKGLGDELEEQAAGVFAEVAFPGVVAADEEDIGGKAGSDVPVAGEILAVVEGEDVREWANGESRFWMASPTCAAVRLVSACVSVNLERRSTSLATARIEVVPVVWTGRLPVRRRGSC